MSGESETLAMPMLCGRSMCFEFRRKIGSSSFDPKWAKVMWAPVLQQEPKYGDLYCSHLRQILTSFQKLGRKALRYNWVLTSRPL